MDTTNSTVSNQKTQIPRLIVHSVERAKTCPNASPFVIKLETYLRMADIPYKGKTPWITIDGEDICDSQLIIEFLNKKLNINLWGNATIEEKGISQAMRVMLEDRFLCGIAEWRWITNVDNLDEIFEWSGMKLFFVKKLVSRKVKSALHTQGFGRHSPEDRLRLVTDDLRAVANYLGNKPFFLGDTPTGIDCTIFAIMAQCVYCAHGSPCEKIINDEFPNIRNYCTRMKERFYSDWDNLLATSVSK